MTKASTLLDCGVARLHLPVRLFAAANWLFGTAIAGPNLGCRASEPAAATTPSAPKTLSTVDAVPATTPAGVPRPEGQGGSATPNDASAGAGPVLCTEVDSARWIATKVHYQWPGAQYPQIAQGDEYGPIEAIQALYADVSGGKADASFGKDEQVECKATDREIVITSPVESTTVSLLDGAVKVGDRLLKDNQALALFSTLTHVLRDLGARCEHQGIRGARYASRAYQDNIVLEFRYSQLIVELAALSNGPSDPERLYVLDVVRMTDSDLWSEQAPDKGNARTADPR